MKIISVVGTRPNFIKIAPLVRATDKYNSQFSINNNQSPKSPDLWNGKAVERIIEVLAIAHN